MQITRYKKNLNIICECSSIQFLTSGAGSKAWKGDIHDSPHHDNVKFYYDGQGFMSVQLTKLTAHIVFYDASGRVRYELNLPTK
ncbi:acid phosphatase, partial [Sarracenia purpurea var. burkii]